MRFVFLCLTSPSMIIYSAVHIAVSDIISLFFDCTGSSLLCGLFSNCGKPERLFVAVLKLLIAVAPLAVE